jgi:signal transduction histidine kinase/HAMP domain-containing protein
VRLIWWSLQSMNADALNAAYASNLIGVGEEQRQYLNQRQALQSRNLNADQAAFLSALENVVWGPSGLFETRRLELASNLAAQNALFRIRQDANRISEVASAYAAQAEAFLAGERQASSRTIRTTRLTVAAISLVSLTLALAAAIYVSRYVTFNISRVSNAMVRLADGDHDIALPRKIGGEDEIGDLFRSFRSFRANALRLNRSNRQLDQRNTLFRKVFVNISDGVAITDASGRITGRNPAFVRILGAQSSSGRSQFIMDILRASPFCASVDALKLTHTHRGFCELQSDAGQILEIRASELPDDGRVWLVSDVTERRKITDRIQQIDRIETLGKVAGDTAHDFANILSAIRTHSHLLKSQERDQQQASLEAIENAVEFGSSLTDRLLAFARKQSLKPENVDLKSLIEGMMDLIEISLKPDVQLDMALPSEPVFVTLDPGQFESALFNLVLNANHAITHAGTIRVSLRQSENGEATVLVEDNGKGMPRDVLDRAIEPFFTTRAGHGGTGLGLSIVYGFITQTGGELNIESEVGMGTRIEVILPRGATPHPTIAQAPEKTCLLVEDDRKTLAAVKAMLERIGFRVTAEGTGEDALTSLREGKFDLLLTDLDLGGNIDGLAVIAASKMAAPSTETILMSGKSAEQCSVPQDTGYIAKPVTEEALTTYLSQAGQIEL